MPDLTTKVLIAGDAKGAVKAFADTAAAADATAGTIGSKFEGMAERTGGVFASLGNQLSTWGIPFGASVATIGDKFASAESSGQKFSAAMSTIGAVTLAAVAAGFVAIGVEAVKAATSYDAAMERVHTQAGASQAEVDRMKQALIDLAPAVATGPEELATALYHVESTGVRGAKALEEVKIAAEGAKVGGANLEDVTNALNATIASGIPGVQNMGQAMGALNAIVGAGDMKMQDLADALGSGVLAVVKGFGLSLNDVGAALATFGDNNIRGAEAATMLRMSVMSMAKPAATGKKALDELGLSTTQLAEDMQSGGLVKAVTDLHDRLVATGNDGNKAGELLTEAFGKKAGPGIAVLISQFSRFQSKVEEVKAGAKNFGSDWQATTHTLSYQMSDLRATVEALGIKFGDFLIPKLEATAHAIAGVITWMEKHKAVAEALAVSIGVVLGGAVATFAITKVAQFVGGIQSMIEKVGAFILQHRAMAMGIIADDEETAVASDSMFGVWGIAIAALIAVILLLKDHWHAVWTDIVSVAKTVWEGGIKPVFDAFRTAGDALWHAIDTAWHAIDSVIQWVGDHIVEILKVVIAVGLGPIGIAIDLLWTHWTTVWHAISDAVDAVWSVMSPIFSAIGTALTAVIGTAVDALEAVWSVAWSAIKDAASAAWAVIDAVVIVPIKLAFGAVGDALSVLQEAFSTVWNVIKSVISSVWDFIKPILDAMKSAIDAVSSAVHGISSVAGAIGGGISKAASFIGLASGGLVEHPTLAVVGEAGPEMVIPLSQLGGIDTTAERIVPLSSVLSSAGAAASSAAAAGGPVAGTTATVVQYAPQIIVNGSQLDETALQRAIAAGLAEHGATLEQSLVSKGAL